MNDLPPGIRRHGAGYQVEVRVTGHPRHIQPFPAGTPIEEMVRARAKKKKELQRSAPARGTAGSLSADVRDCLKAHAADGKRSLMARATLLAFWEAEFGTRASVTIKPWEIRAVRDRWLTVGPKIVYRDKKRIAIAAPLSASTVNNRMRALENLYTVIYGRKADNPVREVPEANEPEGDARGLPYDVVEAILAQMPDQRYRPVVSADQIATIRAAPRSVSGVALARQLGLSDQIVSRVRNGRLTVPSTRDGASLTKLRLRVMAYVGVSQNELAGIAPGDLHLDDVRGPWVQIKGRKKGKGTKSTAQPLTDQGAAALRELVAAGGMGSFSTASMRTSFLRACAKLGLHGLHPYDLRHSFASEIFATTGDLKLTQLLMRQKDDRTTLRYGRGAVPAVLAAAIAKVRAAQAFGAGALLARSSVETSKEPGSSVELSPLAFAPVH
jgi:integrase